jgi:hypothetical protein
MGGVGGVEMWTWWELVEVSWKLDLEKSFESPAILKINRGTRQHVIRVLYFHALLMCLICAALDSVLQCLSSAVQMSHATVQFCGFCHAVAVWKENRSLLM